MAAPSEGYGFSGFYIFNTFPAFFKHLPHVFGLGDFWLFMIVQNDRTFSE